MSIVQKSPISPSVRAVVRDDGAVLMDTNSGLIFSLNEVGGLIWERLRAGDDSPRIAASIAERYGVAIDDVRRDVDGFIDELKRSKLVGGG